MAVVKVIDGIVVQTWKDVSTVEEAVAKYGLDPQELVEGDHPQGTMYDGRVFHPPVFPPNPIEKHGFERAIRVLMRSAPRDIRTEIEDILK